MGRRIAHKGRGFFGETIYYDKNYNEIGRTAKGFIGYNVYDKDLNKVGHATDNFWGGKDYYDLDYHKIGSVNRALFMGHNQYDVNRNQIGHSGPNLLGGESVRGGHPVNDLLNEQSSGNGGAGSTKNNRTDSICIPNKEKSFDERHPILFSLFSILLFLFLLFLLGVFD